MPKTCRVAHSHRHPIILPVLRNAAEWSFLWKWKTSAAAFMIRTMKRSITALTDFRQNAAVYDIKTLGFEQSLTRALQTSLHMCLLYTAYTGELVNKWAGDKVNRWTNDKVNWWPGDKVNRWTNDKVNWWPGELVTKWTDELLNR